MMPPLLETAAQTIAVVALVVLPGLTLLVWLVPRLEIDWFGRLILSTGLSLALFPLMFLWLRVAGPVRVGAVLVYCLLAASALLSTWGLWRHRKWHNGHERLPGYFGWLALALTLLAVGVRLWAIKGLTIPSWADSYHHTMIAQLIVDNGGLFDSWQPYAPLESLNYHFGFHTTVALFHWLTGTNLPGSVLFVGQIINALAALAIYPLAVRLTKDWRAGLLASFVAAMLTPHPAYFVNWGRYTQLAGQVILPLALWLTWELVDHRWNWQRLFLAALAVAGLGLTHYRVVLMYVLIGLAWWLVYVLGDADRRRQWPASVAKLAATGATAILMILPWLVHLAFSRLLVQQANLAAGNVPHGDYVVKEYNQFHDILLFFPLPILGLAGIGFVLSLIYRRRLAAFVTLWVGFLFLMANPNWLHLPGTGLVNNFAVDISLYMPVSILIGAGLAWLIGYACRVWRYAAWLALVAVAAMAVYALPYQLHIVKPEFVYVTPADERAMAWIEENTPADARFLINGFMAYGGTTPAGADAGWWLPLLAGRQNSIPPLEFTAETPAYLGLARETRDLVAGLQQVGVDSPAGLELLHQYGITHVYIGAKDGRVWNTGQPLLSAADLQASPDFRLLYHEDNVWVFSLLP